MKMLKIDSENPNGIFAYIADEPVSEQVEAAEPIKTFFEGLANADTNSIAKIRALARDFLEKTGE